MDAALDAARDAARHGDVPVGAAVFSAERVVAVAGNARERDGDPTAHAEILALRAAADAVGTWRLDGHGIAVTLEPCPMCAGAVVAARLDLVVFGAADPKAGAAGSLYNLCADPRLNHECVVVAGHRADEGAALLWDFFGQRR